jgi:hypothetical protein
MYVSAAVIPAIKDLVQASPVPVVFRIILAAQRRRKDCSSRASPFWSSWLGQGRLA